VTEAFLIEDAKIRRGGRWLVRPTYHITRPWPGNLSGLRESGKRNA